MIIGPKQLGKDSYQISNYILVKYKSGKSNAAFIPHGVSEIGPKAFEGCVNLSIILIPETVKKIDHQAFKDCARLKYINIPESVNYIGEDVFDGCTNLKSLYIPDSVLNCHLLGCPTLAFLRMPLKLWNLGVLIDTEVEHLILALPEENKDVDSLFDTKVFDHLIKTYPRISFEPNKSEDSIGSFISIDGCIVNLTTYETTSYDDYEGIFESISNSTLALPSIAEVLNYHCVNEWRQLPLYIPESVMYIDSKAFEMWAKPILVTPKSNYQHLTKILQKSETDETIYVC